MIFKYKISSILLVLLFLISLTNNAFSQTITKATGGGAITADNFGGTWTTLTGPIIQETSPGQLSSGTFRLKAPSGFVWDVTGANPIATVTSPKAGKITVTYSTRNASEIEFTITGSSGGTPKNNPHRVVFSGLRIRPGQGSPLVSGIIQNVGSAAPGGTTSYGDIVMVAGADSRIRVETAPTSAGALINAQNIVAGNSLVLYSNVRDQFGNFKRNQSATWTTENETGSVIDSDLTSASGTTSTFSPLLTGSANVRASFGGLTAVQTEILTVTPSAATDITIVTQPSSNAVAGTAFASQPVIHIVDTYGNIVTTDNFTQITATRNSGTGTLQGTTTITASGGIATFSNLSHNVANNIDLSFSATGFNDVVSNSINVNPATASGLIFSIPPSNGNTGQIVPVIETQVIDAFQNPVDTAGLTVNLNIDVGNGTLTNGSAVTDGNGNALFGSVVFSNKGDKTIFASSTGLNNSLTSNIFTIADGGTLAGFQILTTSDAAIGTQEAGVPFNIKILAVDGIGTVLDGSGSPPNQIDEFTGFVDITTTSAFSGTTTTTSIGPFVAGVFSSHSVELIQSGVDQTITATNSAGTESGSSNTFLVTPSSPDPDSSLIFLSDSSLVANSGEQSVATVQLRDSFGNLLDADVSETILISLTGTGSIGSTTGNGDGTYSATITAPSAVGSATVGASIDAVDITSGDPTLTYTFGDLSTFLVEAPGGGTIATQVAGVPFNIQITALDAFGNTVTSFSGAGNTVGITSSGTLSAGGGITAIFTSGVLNPHSVTLTNIGPTTITARKTASSEEGTSASLTVNPGAADPTTSTITPGIPFLLNDGVDNTLITIQLKDAFGNNLTTNPGTVNLNKNGASASLPSTATYVSNGAYTATLTASGTQETVTINADLNGGTTFTDNAVVLITQFNVWQGDAGGNASNRLDWGNTQNWSLGSLPTTNEVVNIPSGLSFYPTIDGEDPVLDVLNIETGALVTVSGRTLTINNELTGNGSLFGSTSTINLGGNSSLSNFISGSSDVYINGSATQNIQNDFTANNLFVENNVNVSNYLEAFSSLTIDLGNTMSLQTGSELAIIGNITVNGTLVGNNSNFGFGGNITVGGSGSISLTNTSLELNGTTEQQVNGIESIKSFTINNNAGVVINNDIEVTDTLFLTNGTLTIESGNSFVSNVKIGNTSNIIAKREITGSVGWRLLSAPLASSYGEFLSGVITQGYTGSTLGNAPLDSLQPNVLYYDETYTGTDNQRYRTLTDTSLSVVPGQGLFVFFFDDQSTAPIPDSRYNNPLPDTIQIRGEENDGDGTNFTFPVTYTVSADTGWNLVGNPFTATIDWDDGNWTKTNMDNSIYVWDPITDDYLTWNGLTGSLGDGTIKPFQGFWVKANGNGPPSLKVNKASKTVGGTFYKQNRGEPKIEVTVTAEGMSKSTHFSFTEYGSFGKDTYDAYRLIPFERPSYLELFSLLNDGTQLTINNLPRDFGIPIDIPIYVSGYKDGLPIDSDFEISWNVIEEVPTSWTVQLLDKNKKFVSDLDNSETLKFAPTVKNKLAAKNSSSSALSTNSITQKDKSFIGDSDFYIRVIPGDDAADLPNEISLSQNYPNPFNPETTIEFAIPLQTQVSLIIYDVLGREVSTIVDEQLNAGFYSYNWDASSLASGVYFYRLITSEKVFLKRMALIK